MGRARPNLPRVLAIVERLLTTTDTYDTIAADLGSTRPVVNSIAVGNRWVSITGGAVERPEGTVAVAKEAANKARAATRRAKEAERKAYNAKRRAEKARLKFRVADCRASREVNTGLAIERLEIDWTDARAQKVLLGSVGDELKPRIAAERLGIDRDEWKHAIKEGDMGEG